MEEIDPKNYLQRKKIRQPNIMIKGSRKIDNFKQLNKIDEGSYGIVYRAKDLETGEIVAIKKIKLGKEKEGFPITSLREINILFNLNHPNILKIKEVVYGNSMDKIFTVMEYMDYELKNLLSERNYILTLSNIKCLMKQLLIGVEYMHKKWIIHRDLKTSNLLLSDKGILKIGDFGLARKYGSPLRHFTPLVVTLWYRAPELLLDSEKYTKGIDIWSVGCIFAELFLREPLIQGQDELDQLNRIFKLLGTPTEESWPGWNNLPNAKKINFKKYNVNKLRESFPSVSTTNDLILTDKGYDLLNKMLTCNPSKRISASEALLHPWFLENPLPSTNEKLPQYSESNDKERTITKNKNKSLDEVQMQQRAVLHDGEVVDKKKLVDAEYIHQTEHVVDKFV